MRRAILVTLALALSLTACQSPREPVRAPATAAHSEAVTSPAAPTVAMTAGFKVSDVQEAEKVYREFYAALLDTQRAGGATKLPPTLRAYLEPPASSYIEALVKADYDEGARLASRQDGRLKLAPAEGRYRGDSLVALRACADERSLRFSRRDGATARGRVLLNYVYFHRNSRGDLVFFDSTTDPDKSPCL